VPVCRQFLALLVPKAKSQFLKSGSLFIHIISKFEQQLQRGPFPLQYSLMLAGTSYQQQIPRRLFIFQAEVGIWWAEITLIDSDHVFEKLNF
jgi:hypothetical protein